jgi:hypothetical protein
VEWYWQGKTEKLVDKLIPVPLCLPHLPHGLAHSNTQNIKCVWRLTHLQCTNTKIQFLPEINMFHLHYNEQSVNVVYRKQLVSTVGIIKTHKYTVQQNVKFLNGLAGGTYSLLAFKQSYSCKKKLHFIKFIKYLKFLALCVPQFL